MGWIVVLLFVLVPIAALVVWIFALVDCIQVPDDAMYQSGTKLIWVLVIVLTNVIGAIIYLAIGRPEQGTPRPTHAVPPPPPPPV